MLTYIAIGVAIVMVLDMLFHDKMAKLVTIQQKEVVPVPIPQPKEELTKVEAAYLAEIEAAVKIKNFDLARHLMAQCEEYSKGLQIDTSGS